MVDTDLITFDVIITTNNRAESLKTLVVQLLLQSHLPGKIIVVDSSLEANADIQLFENVTYIRSSHANQPYQRYVGYLASSAHIIIYFDDDMEVVGTYVLKKIIDRFKRGDLVGLAINFAKKNEFLQKTLPKSRFLKVVGKNKGVMRRIKIMSGLLELKDGKYGYNGLKGKQPDEGGQTEWFSGGAFAVKAKSMYENFNFKLFDIYEKGLGKGEDGITGYTVSKNGTIYSDPEELLLHVDKKDSTYTKDIYSFSRRVSYSRMYLTNEFCRLNNRSQKKSQLLYHWFIFWRVMGMLLNQVFNYRESRSQMIKGTLSGWYLALIGHKSLKGFDDGSYWISEAQNDLNI